MVKIKWFGHACFALDGKDVTVITDPHGGVIGLDAPSAKADIVLISHGHFDHNSGVGDVSKAGAKHVSSFVGEDRVKEISIKGIATAHDEKGGKLRGNNSIYVFEIDGMRFCHCGDLGHTLSAGQITEIGKVDVLFVPVGGVFTVDAAGATQVIKAIKPKIAVPMHYAVSGLTVGVKGVGDFLKDKKNIRQLASPEAEITRESIPKDEEIWVFSIK